MRELLALPAAAQEIAPETGRLSVTGSGEAAAAPDMATLTIGVSERADTAAAAMDATSAVTARLLERLAEFGVASRDVQTGSLSLNPVYAEPDGPRQAPEIAGFEAGNMLTVRLREIDRVGAALAALLDDGANALHGIAFSVADPEPLLNEARRRAVADARARAELYAEAAGVGLGPLVELRGETGRPPHPMPMAEMRMAASVPVAGGETGYSAEVTLVYEIAP